MLSDVTNVSLSKRDLMPEHAGWMWAVSLFCVVFLTVVVIIRIWSRLISRRSQPFGLDDWVAMGAWPFVIAMYILIMLAMRAGVGMHAKELNDQQYTHASKLLLACFVLYYMNGDLIRVSLTLYYARLFSSSRIFKRFVWANVALNVAWQVSSTLAAAYQCKDPRSLWDRSIVSECNQPIEHQYLCGISSICLDLIALLLPVPMIYKLQLKPSKKRELLGLFFVSYMVPIFTVTRFIVTLQHASELNDDPMYNWIYVLEWGILENLAGYLGVCMPAILYLSRRWHNRGFMALFNNHTASQADLRKSTFFSEDNSALRKESATFAVSEVSVGNRRPSSPTLEDVAHPMSILHVRTYTVTSEGKNTRGKPGYAMS